MSILNHPVIRRLSPCSWEILTRRSQRSTSRRPSTHTVYTLMFTFCGPQSVPLWTMWIVPRQSEQRVWCTTSWPSRAEWLVWTGPRQEPMHQRPARHRLLYPLCLQLCQAIRIYHRMLCTCNLLLVCSMLPSLRMAYRVWVCLRCHPMAIRPTIPLLNHHLLHRHLMMHQIKRLYKRYGHFVM